METARIYTQTHVHTLNKYFENRKLIRVTYRGKNLSKYVQKLFYDIILCVCLSVRKKISLLCSLSQLV